jgi:hypothetical protein
MRPHPYRRRGKQYFQCSIWLTAGNYSHLLLKRTAKEKGSSFGMYIVCPHKYYSTSIMYQVNETKVNLNILIQLVEICRHWS